MASMEAVDEHPDRRTAALDEETEVVEAVMAYLRDRLEFERWALPVARDDDAYDETLRRHETFQRRHRTRAAALKIGVVTIGDPPTVDPDHTTVVAVKVRGAKATVETRERRPDRPAPETFEYRLEREDGRWLLADRWQLESGSDAGYRRIKGLL